MLQHWQCLEQTGRGGPRRHEHVKKLQKMSEPRLEKRGLNLTFWETFLRLHGLLSQLRQIVQLFSRLPQVDCAAFRQADLLLRTEIIVSIVTKTIFLFMMTLNQVQHVPHQEFKCRHVLLFQHWPPGNSTDNLQNR